MESPLHQIFIQQAMQKFDLIALYSQNNQYYSNVYESTLNTPIEGVFIQNNLHKIYHNRVRYILVMTNQFLQ